MSYQDWQRMAGRDLDDAKEARALRVENAELEAALRLSREAIQNLVDTENILRTQLAREVDRARLQLSQLARTREALEAIEPHLPILDASPARFSAHAQAAGLVRAALRATQPATGKEET